MRKDIIRAFVDVLFLVLVVAAVVVAVYFVSEQLRDYGSSENVTPEIADSVVVENIEYVGNLTVNNYNEYPPVEAQQSLDQPADNIYALLSQVILPCMVCITIIVGIVIIYVIQRE